MVVVSYGKLIPSSILGRIELGGINMHPSLLPKYRGPAPIYHCLLNGDEETGVTILELSLNKFDSGKILMQQKVPVPSNATFLQLSSQLAQIGADCLLRSLSNLNEMVNKATPQDDNQATHAPKVKKGMGFVDFVQQTPEQIYRIWRALGDTVGVHFRYLQQHQDPVIVRLVNLVCPSDAKMSYQHVDADSYSPGMLKYDIKNELLFVKCKQEWLACSQLQVLGRRVLTAKQFVNGYNLLNVKNPCTDHLFVKVNEPF